jgi:crotonobetainyl-CoA:carnitine CoA-transferase CaiB-like acyl-CoA transferase
MAGYDFLKGLRAIEVAQLGPSALGGYLADMGAEVIKVEGLDGDPIRYSGTPTVGSPDGVSFLHLRWNRGKQSMGVDLKTAEGIELFKRLVASSDIVIEGMRAGVLDRLGLGYDVLRGINPRVVFCSISGLGSSGPYHTLGSHGPSYDAFGALSHTNPYSLTPEEKVQSQITSVGMHAMGLHAALGTLAAVVRAQRTGEGAMIEVAAAESAAHWLPEGVDVVLNEALVHQRPGFLNNRNKMKLWPRLCDYETKDKKSVFFQGLSPKFWTRFCAAIDRPDLHEHYVNASDDGEADEAMHDKLGEVFRARTLAEWMDLFRAHDVPGGPANTVRDLASDPHFLARDNVYEVELPGAGTLRLTTTPVRTLGQNFSPKLAPDLAQDTDAVLTKLLGLDGTEIAQLRANNVIF